MKKDLNIELLRIILMLFIIMHHLLLNGFGLRGITMNNYDQLNILWGGINAFLVVAVNIFFIISGYYSIRISMKKIVNIALMVYFYFILISLCFVLLGKEQINIDLIKSVIFPISSYWFILVYIILSVFSPLINKMLENCNKVMLTHFLISAGLIFCVYGFIIENPTIGVNNGYSLIFAFFLYIIGYYLRHHFNRNKNKYVFLLVYFVISGFNGLLAMLFIFLDKGTVAWTLYNYNNPLVVIGSVSLFLYFKDLNIENNKLSRTIYYASNSVLAVYIIHSSSSVATYFNQFLRNYSIKLNFLLNTVFLLLYSIAIFCVCAFIEEMVRKKLFLNIFNKFSNNISNKLTKLINNLIQDI
ncbi:acyltransferase [Paenibacillus wynnii]|uniref:acyltransferase n=1 Tax=Paenibacillus wynnii TaxID=268407 RepID=UPI00278DE6A9|nr:acyltransferase [Paenibacillus wynnii]MDQ0196275.1 surface polysaccharide O-acyltransferase-like enzyme [Paenibacillus wynnii]